jgi:hypothetical protein
VDDILTSGATAHAASLALKEAGAAASKRGGNRKINTGSKKQEARSKKQEAGNKQEARNKTGKAKSEFKHSLYSAPIRGTTQEHSRGVS